jgi:hypothetical protein
MRFLIGGLLVCVLCSFHPLHVSVTEINYDEKERSLEIMSRIFADDLETTMRKRLNQPDLDILNPSGKTLDQMMTEYFAEKVHISLDGKRQAIRYLGHEKDGDVFVFYVAVEKIKKWRKVAIQNALLTEAFDDQSNLVHVTAFGKVRSLRLNKDNPSDELSFVD